MESDCGDDASAHTDLTHRPQLLGPLPPTSVIALEQHVGKLAAGDQALHQLRRFASEDHVAHSTALRLADRQCFDIAVIVGDLEATEFAVTTPREERRMEEIAERALTGVE